MAALLANYIRRQRLAVVAPYVRGDVLDIGCQGGQMLHHASRSLGRYVGIDVDERALARAREAFPDKEFIRLDIDEERFGFAEEFDTVLMVALIEHILNQGHLLRECRAALRSGGELVLTTPTTFGNDIVHRCGAALGLFHKAVADDHVVIYNKTRLRAVCAKIGFELSHYRRFQFGCNQFAVLRRTG